MDVGSRGRRGGVWVAIAGVVAIGTVMVLGAVLRPWPLVSGMFMGRESPIGHLVELALDYPNSRLLAGLSLTDLPLGVRVITLLPVAVQAVVVVMLTVVAVDLLAALSRGPAFRARVRSRLKVLSVLGVVGGLVQFGVGMLAWQHFQSTVMSPASRIDYELPLPDWPITLVIIGLLAGALWITFRAGDRLKQDEENVI